MHKESILAKAEELGFSAAGVADVRASEHREAYERWVAEGHHGGMAYLARPDARQRRYDLTKTLDNVRSAIVVAHAYGDPDGVGGSPPDRGVIARYARGRDYHRVIPARLRRLHSWIEDQARQPVRGRVYVDTGPVLERELGWRAGLGWFGRNTMLIHPRRGSWFFLGVLLLDVDLEPAGEPVRDHCGTCNACVEACPTGALLGRDADGAPRMDARRCISYLTIEHRGSIPLEHRSAIGNRIFGCDICQEVCPFNVRFGRPTNEPGYAARGPGEPPFGVQRPPGYGASSPGTDAPPLLELMRMSEDEWDAWTRGSAIRRAGYAGFKRNVAIALGNWLAVDDGAPPEARDVLEEAVASGDPLVQEHAAWALEQGVGGESP